MSREGNGWWMQSFPKISCHRRDRRALNIHWMSVIWIEYDEPVVGVEVDRLRLWRSFLLRRDFYWAVSARSCWCQRWLAQSMGHLEAWFVSLLPKSEMLRIRTWTNRLEPVSHVDVFRFQSNLLFCFSQSSFSFVVVSVIHFTAWNLSA